MDGLNLILKKLIKTGTGRSRFVLAIIGLSVAMILLLAAVQIQSNYDDLLHSKSNQDSIANFLVLNKILSDQNLGATALSDIEINDLRQQSFVESVGLLNPASFKASIQSSSNRFPFYTDISFESVPDEFIDVMSKDWNWNEESQIVPVIVPNMFLDFYNFQFSFSQNLPQLTPQVVKMIVFKINLYGPNGTITRNARVVGFSDRISSLLVPQDFMRWANNHFGKRGELKASRVIIKTKDPGNPLLVKYLQKNHFTTDADKTRFSRYRQVVDMVVAISGITGIVMLIFALLIFSLFIQLTISSCRIEIILLITLGASPNQLKGFLMRQFYPINILIMITAIGVIAILQFYLHQILSRQHIFLHSLPSINTVMTALGLLIVIWYVNFHFVRKYILESDKND